MIAHLVFTLDRKYSRAVYVPRLMRRRLRLLWSVALLLASLLAAVACTSNEPETPEGFTRAAAASRSFAYPSGWKELPTRAIPDGWSFIAESGSKGRVLTQIGVFTNLPKDVDAQMAGEAALSGPENAGYRFQREGGSPIEVPNAEEAYRMNFSYEAVVNDEATGQRVRGTDITTVDQSGRAVVIRITGWENRLSEAIVQRIVKSIVVTS